MTGFPRIHRNGIEGMVHRMTGFPRIHWTGIVGTADRMDRAGAGVGLNWECPGGWDLKRGERMADRIDRISQDSQEWARGNG
jgi:hypothetical protein